MSMIKCGIGGVAQVFDPADITDTLGAPSFRGFCERVGGRLIALQAFDSHAAHDGILSTQQAFETKSQSVRSRPAGHDKTHRTSSIVPALAQNARACPERSRKDGAPTVL